MSTKDKIRELNDMTDVEVECPEWGTTIVVRSPSVATRAALIERHRDADSGKINFLEMQMSMLVSTCLDPDDPTGGTMMFEDADREWLVGKNAAVVERLFKKGMVVSGMMTDDGELAYEGTGAPSEVDLGKDG